MLDVEQWAEIRREHLVRGVSIKELVRRTGLARNTVRAALRSEAPPVFQVPERPSKLEPIRDEIHRLLKEDPKLPGVRVRELIEPLGFDGGKTILDDYLREVRPLFRRQRTYQRTVYRPGEICQWDLWQTSRPVPVGHGQERRAWVVVACLGHSRAGAGALVFSKEAPDVLWGMTRCLWALAWARESGDARVWAIEDCRHVTGRLERFLIARGERVVRVASKLTGAARRGVREPGKADEIDALAIARVALREGVDTLPAAHLDPEALEIRRLSDHRERLVGQRTALINDLRWQLHDLDPSFEVPARSLKLACWQRRTATLLNSMPASVQVRIARDELERVGELTTAINALQAELAERVRAYRPGLLTLPGCGVLTAAKTIGETAGVQRFPIAAKFARITGAA